MNQDIIINLIEKLTQSLSQKPILSNSQNTPTTHKNIDAKNKIIEVLRHHDEISKRIDKTYK